MKHRAWSKDDGKRASGEGALRIVVGPTGEVTGSVEGPLGPADLAGTADAKHLLASFTPRSAEPTSFAGSVEGTLEGDALEILLRAADGSAETVRAGKATLKRATPP